MARSSILWITLCALIAVLSPLAVCSFMRTGGTTVPVELLTATTPIALHIAYNTTSIPLNAPSDQRAYSGTAVYTFRNRSQDDVSLEFPPHDVFWISEHSTGSAEMPELFLEPRTLALAPGEDFSLTGDVAFTGENVTDAEFGFLAVVFASCREGNTGNLTGTVFPTCTIEDAPRGRENDRVAQ